MTFDSQAGFEDLQKCLMNAPIFSYPQFNSSHPFIFDTDWSLDHNAISGVLFKVLITYTARKLQPSMPNIPM